MREYTVRNTGHLCSVWGARLRVRFRTESDYLQVRLHAKDAGCWRRLACIRRLHWFKMASRCCRRDRSVAVVRVSNV